MQIPPRDEATHIQFPDAASWHCGDQTRRVVDDPSMINAWYPIAFSTQIPDNSHKLNTQLFGEPIVVYRDESNLIVRSRTRD